MTESPDSSKDDGVFSGPQVALMFSSLISTVNKTKRQQLTFEMSSHSAHRFRRNQQKFENSVFKM